MPKKSQKIDTSPKRVEKTDESGHEARPQAANGLLGMTVRELIEHCRDHGNYERGRGYGYSHVLEDEFGNVQATILIGLGPYGQDLADHHEIAAPGVRFALGPAANPR